MKIKTAELTGAALDWAVAKCEGLTVEIRRHSSHPTLLIFERGDEYGPSYNWAQVGPIIEREKIATMHGSTLDPEFKEWHATDHGVDDTVLTWRGPTPLIAAMRCYVASKLSDEVEVPNELL